MTAQDKDRCRTAISSAISVIHAAQNMLATAEMQAEMLNGIGRHSCFDEISRVSVRLSWIEWKLTDKLEEFQKTCPESNPNGMPFDTELV